MKKAIVLSLMGFLLLSPMAVRAMEVTATWNPAEDASVIGYRLYYGTASRQYDTWVDVGLEPQAVVTNLMEGIRYFFTVTAWNACCESVYSNEASIIKWPEGTDLTPPLVDILHPLDGAQVLRKSWVSIGAEATDNVGISDMEITVNGAVLCHLQHEPWICPWRVPNRQRRTYVLEARAKDPSGNMTTSDPVWVTSR